MIQLILHLVGDYLTQSDWMANNKRKRTVAAFCHALVYSLPFLLIGSIPAVAVIFSTHLLIDRFGLARYVVWFKNRLLQPNGGPSADDEFHFAICGPDSNKETAERVAAGRAWESKWSWANCSTTGYPSESPPWLSVWLLIFADNTLHLAINYGALCYL